MHTYKNKEKSQVNYLRDNGYQEPGKRTMQPQSQEKERNKKEQKPSKLQT